MSPFESFCFIKRFARFSSYSRYLKIYKFTDLNSVVNIEAIKYANKLLLNQLNRVSPI